MRRWWWRRRRRRWRGRLVFFMLSHPNKMPHLSATSRSGSVSLQDFPPVGRLHQSGLNNGKNIAQYLIAMQVRPVQVGQHDIKLRVSSSLGEKEILLSAFLRNQRCLHLCQHLISNKKNPSTDPSDLEMKQTIVSEDHLWIG